MPRKVFESDPIVINSVVRESPTKTINTHKHFIEVATTNKDKIIEIERILVDWVVKPVSLDIEEIQSLNSTKVAENKAKLAYEANGYNPILVEDTSLEVRGLNGFPGTYVKDFFDSIESRKLASEIWLNGKDRTAIAKVTLAIYDGKEVKTWEGSVTGKIAETLKGTNGFGWDDIFIPDGQNIKKRKTFAEMTSKQKDKFSMRVLALKKFLQDPPTLNHPIYMLPEPYEQELNRVQLDKIENGPAKKFAYTLESIQGNKPNKNFTAESYNPIYRTDNIYFTRFLPDKNSKSIGLMLTDMDRKHLKFHKNGDPFLWQMGPERRYLALVQRADFFARNQSDEIHKTLDELEKNLDKFPTRSNRRSTAVETALGIEGYSNFTRAVSLREIGYKKQSSDTYTSRTRSATTGLFNKIGKYIRSIYAVGCLPWVSGWRDVIVTGALGHMPVFVHRNNINAIDFNNQLNLIKESKAVIESLSLGKKQEKRAMQNIGAALGCNPKNDLEKAKRLYKEAGVKLFRIYTINSDSNVVETARALRQEFGDEIEIFVGQLADLKQCKKLIAEDIRADGLVFGNGGGRQCTSATNGMALTTLEELYSISIEPAFNNTTIMVEGGLGPSVGALIVMGVDGILRNAQFANCVIEQGDVYFEHKNGDKCQPYHGSASAAGMVIESYNPENHASRLFASGRTKNVEGTSGYIYYSEKANSMTFYVDQFKHYAARTLADIGVGSIYELRKYLQEHNEELLRIVSSDASYISSPWNSN